MLAKLILTTILATAILTQRPVPTPPQICVGKIVSSLAALEATIEDIQAKAIKDGLIHVLELVQLVEGAEDQCQNVTEQEFNKYMEEHLPQQFQVCITNAKTSYTNLRLIKTYIDQKKYGAVINAAKFVVPQIKETLKTCDGILPHQRINQRN